MQDAYPPPGRAHALWRDLSRPMPTAVLALGITQIIAWGTTLYALGVLGAPIVAETGWSRSLVFGGLSLSLIVASIVSVPVGRLIDRYGGRVVMTAGSVLIAGLLALLAIVRTEAAYLAVWAGLGLAMRMNLYDAAFAALVQIAAERGRRAISYLTLFGGFASTVFWPIGHALAASVGWRDTILIFAAINLVVCVPLHWFGLARRETPGAAAANGQHDQAPPAPPPLEGARRQTAIVILGAVLAGTAFVFGAVSVHLPAILEAAGVAATAAVALASMKGVAQVAGRVWELVYAKRLPPLDLARVSIGLLPVSFLILLLAGSSIWGAAAFTLVLGVSNGLVTIVRGAVPLALFGSQGYGVTLGKLATPYLLLNAVAPAAFAVATDALGPTGALLIVFASGALSYAGIEAMARWSRRGA